MKISRIFRAIRIRLRFFIKRITGQKINLLFVCNRPNVWTSLQTVFCNAINDKKFNVVIVAVPSKKQLSGMQFSHDIYESEGSEVFFSQYHDVVVNGYDYDTGKWKDLKKFLPDYIFFQMPYNVFRPKSYNSRIVSRYAKICYVHYAANVIGNGVLEETYPSDFMQYVDFVFSQNKYDDKLVKRHLKKIRSNCRVFLTGFPRWDNIGLLSNKETDAWSFSEIAQRKIIWTPRWSTNEGNCHFFDYKDKFLKFCDENKNIAFLFRPHPQAFYEWNSTGELSSSAAKKYIDEYKKRKNADIDLRKEYFSTFFHSDLLVTDISSIMADYFLTGKPIVYCHRVDCFNDFSRKLSEAFYWVKNWHELEKVLKMLISGIDPLKKKRRDLLDKYFQFSSVSAGEKIIKLIKDDFNGI